MTTKRFEVRDHHTGGRIMEGTEEQTIDWLVRNPQYPVDYENERSDGVHVYFVTFHDC